LAPSLQRSDAIAGKEKKRRFMAQKTQTPETRRDASVKSAAPHREGGFKPLAIPAVAAAVSAGASARAHEAARRGTGPREIPAVLRQDGFVD
jgi:hypothetical protein